MNEKRSLSCWCSKQRVRFARNKLEQKYINLLEKVPVWSWSANEQRWWDKYNAVISYYEKNLSLPPKNYRTEDGLDLNSWLYINNKTQADLEGKKREAIEKIKFLASASKND